MTQYFAHSANKSGSSWEPLKEHTRCVAKRASEYAGAFDAGQEAMIAGLWHDLGKYSELFTRRLKGEVSGLDHWTAGAYATLRVFKDKAIASALAIQGHHIGLQEGFAPAIKELIDMRKLSGSKKHPLGLTLTESDDQVLLKRFGLDGFVTPQSPSVPLYSFKDKSVSAMLNARMLFSTLVDADYIETEAHFEGRQDGAKVYRPLGPSLQAPKAFDIVMAYLNEFECNTRSSGNVQSMRRKLLDVCLAKADGPTGIFTLTAPTGAGKTLAMLAFALKHAKIHPKIRRIVMVVPFLSIIEQTAAVYRQVLEPHFGSHYVLENHSLSNLIREKNDNEQNQDNEGEALRTAQLLAENWDAPLVLTTSVQFFESMFDNRPGKCRKLHRLANSIILFDEAQTFPTHLAVPSLASLSHLAERYGCTVVFSTATQPAFDHLHNKVKQYAQMGWFPQAIAEESHFLFSKARRVQIDWQIKESRSWKAVADELAADDNLRSLCIVNIKRHAQKLIEHLLERVGEKGLFHLSTNMCPAHRQKVLAEVRARLTKGNTQPCRLVSTQCIEAGVDVDFPVAWRAFGPLDAIAQAAGRCNREGILKQGRMVVFLPEKEKDGKNLYPPGGYKEATETTQTLFNMKENECRENGVPFEDIFDICDPGLFGQYYRLLYDLTGATNLTPDLENALQRRSFVDVAQYYRLINQQSINVLVPYANEITLFESLKERLKNDGRLTRQWIQDARPLTVSLYRPKKGAVIWNYLYSVPLCRGEITDDWFIYLNPKDYDPLMGLKPPDEVDPWIV